MITTDKSAVRKTLIGAGGQAKFITDMFIGVNGKAKKVVSGFIGVDGQAKRFISTSTSYGVDFSTMDGIYATGVWNQELRRIEF